MSSKTRTRKTHTTSTTGSSRPLRPVPDQASDAKGGTDTEDRLWEALRANPNNTGPFLAGAANIGRSTAGKILAKWAKDGSVARTPGIVEGGRRTADLWTITDAEHQLTVDDGPAVPTDAATEHAPEIADVRVTDPAEAEPVGVTEPAATDGDNPGKDGASEDGGSEKPARLAPFALRGMVEDYLHDHPGVEFGPTAIAKALGGKSSGAVSNALDKLVEAGTAVKTKESPKRFALAPTEQTVASTATT